MPSLLDVLRSSPRPLIADGAMGTQLIVRGIKPGACGELLNVERPEVVADIHTAYLNAGCQLLTTNTFGGTRTSLAKHGMESRLRELNEAGARVARQAIEASGKQAWVLGDVGPFGDFLEPVGDVTAEQAREIFAEQIAALKAGGADGIIVETMTDPAEVAVAVQAARAADLPVVATYAFSRAADGDFRTMMGTRVEQAVAAAIEAGATVVGSNCGTGLSLEDYAELARRLVAAAGQTPVILQPNAGRPHASAGGGVTYAASPKEMADLVPVLLSYGVRILGGCCGTSPDHLRAMAAAAA